MTTSSVQDGTSSMLRLCPFVTPWIQQHPGYQDLVYDARRDS